MKGVVLVQEYAGPIGDDDGGGRLAAVLGYDHHGHGAHVDRGRGGYGGVFLHDEGVLPAGGDLDRDAVDGYGQVLAVSLVGGHGVPHGGPGLCHHLPVHPFGDGDVGVGVLVHGYQVLVDGPLEGRGDGGGDAYRLVLAGPAHEGVGVDARLVLGWDRGEGYVPDDGGLAVLRDQYGRAVVERTGVRDAAVALGDHDDLHAVLLRFEGGGEGDVADDLAVLGELAGGDIPGAVLILVRVVRYGIDCVGLPYVEDMAVH